MEIGEAVAVAFTAVNEADPKCDNKPDTKDWQAKLNQWGSQQGCSGTALYKNMKKDRKKDQGYLAPPKAFVFKPPPGKKWKLAGVSPQKFPVQAHHIIPKNHLPDHSVCAFLAKKYTSHDKYQLTADAPYNTDHANNGYCLPYATPLAEWKKVGKGPDAEPWKLNICFDVMKQTRRQLHQGSHRVEPYDGPIADDEEQGIHEVGYLTAVNELLDIVQDGAQEHVANCKICNSGQKQGGKIKLLPREAVVHHMDQVSGIVKLLIDANRTFISEPASLFGETIFGVTEELPLPKWLSG